MLRNGTKTTSTPSHLQQPDRDGHGDAQRAQRPLPLSDGPGVALQLPQQVGQVHVDLLHRLQEPEGRDSSDDPVSTLKVLPDWIDVSPADMTILLFSKLLI